MAIAVNCPEFLSTWVPSGLFLRQEPGAVPADVLEARPVPGMHIIHVGSATADSTVLEALSAQPLGVIARMVQAPPAPVAAELSRQEAQDRADALRLPVLVPGTVLADPQNDRVVPIDAQGEVASPATIEHVLVLPASHLVADHAAATVAGAAPDLGRVLAGPVMPSQLRLAGDRLEVGLAQPVINARYAGLKLSTVPTGEATRTLEGGIIGLMRVLTKLAPEQGVLMHVPADRGEVTDILAVRAPDGVALLHRTPHGVEAATLPRHLTGLTLTPVMFSGEGLADLAAKHTQRSSAPVKQRPYGAAAELARIVNAKHADTDQEHATTGILGNATRDGTESFWTTLSDATAQEVALAYPWLAKVNPERKANSTMDAFTLNCVITSIAVDISLSVVGDPGNQASGVDITSEPEEQGLPETYLATYQAQTLGLPDGESRVYSFGDLEAVRHVMTASSQGARGLVLVRGENAGVSHAFNVVHNAYGVSFLDGQRGTLARPPKVITEVAFLPLTENIRIPNEHPLTVLSPDRRAGAVGFEAELPIRTTLPAQGLENRLRRIATSRNLEVHLDTYRGETILELVSKPYNILDNETGHRPRKEVWRDFTRTLQRVTSAGPGCSLGGLFGKGDGFQSDVHDFLERHRLDGPVINSGRPVAGMYMQYTAGVPLEGVYPLLQYALQHTWNPNIKELAEQALIFADKVLGLYRSEALALDATSGSRHPNSSLALEIMEIRGLSVLIYTHVLAPVMECVDRHHGWRGLVKNQLLASSRTSLAACRDLLSSRTDNWVQANAENLRAVLVAHALDAIPGIRTYLRETGGGNLLDRMMSTSGVDYRLGALLDNALLKHSPTNPEITHNNVFTIRTHVSRVQLAKNGDRLILLELRYHGVKPRGELEDVERDLVALEENVRQIVRSAAVFSAAVGDDQAVAASFSFKKRKHELTKEHHAVIDQAARRIVQRTVASGSAATVYVEGGGIGDEGAQRAAALANALKESARGYFKGAGLNSSLITVQHRSRGNGASASPDPAQSAEAARDSRIALLWLGPSAPQHSEVLNGVRQLSDIRSQRFGSARVGVQTREVSSDYTAELLRERYGWLGAINPGYVKGGEYATNCIIAAISMDMSLRDPEQEVVYEAATTEPLTGDDLLNYQQQVLGLPDGQELLYNVPSIEAAVQALRAAAPGSRAFVVVRQPRRIGHVLVGIRDEHGAAVVDPQTGQLAKLPSNTVGLSLVPLSHDFPQPPVEAVAVSADTVVEAVGAPSWSVRLLGGVRVEHPNVYVLDVVAASRLSEEVARQALITRLGEMADGDDPVVMLWAPRLNTEPLVSDVAALNYLLEQLAQRGQLPVVVSRTRVTDALVTVTRRYGAAIVHTTTRKPNNVSIGLDTYWTASPSSQEDHPDTSRSTFAQITRDLLSQAVTLAHRTPAVARVEDTLGELIWAPNLTAARDVFTTARQRWSTQQIRDNLNRVRQMIERVPDQPDLARYAPVLEFGARGHADIVFDYALADPADRPTTLLTAVGNLEARGQLNSDPEAGLTATQLAAMVTTVGTTGITISVLNVIRDIKKGEFTTAATYINQHKGRLTSDEKGHWVQAIADLQRVPAMEKNSGALEELAAEVMEC
ncbi:toxin glutamine deamidase domain-containing protein [Micromonospora sp. DT4]|uniref:toxin glutamine deamidase domain-containing protein n=1 Tax=Micromonospora sp. DT4 TaxID=3393438 RepID=UPI003CEFF816